MRTAILLAAGLAVATGCAIRRPAYVVVPRGETQSEEPPASSAPPVGVPLPLKPDGRQLLQKFLDRDGRPGGPPVQEPKERAAAHQKVLDALQDDQNLAVHTNDPKTRTFCEDAPKLCSQTSLFQKQPFVRQVVDAREYKRPIHAPLAVRDGNYWWIFYLDSGQRMTHVLLIRDVERSVERSQ